MCQFLSIEYVNEPLDFALMKVDWEKNANKDHLKGKSGFPHLKVSARTLDEGEPVYAFGYPLGTAKILHSSEQMTLGEVLHAPRVTSAIVASTFERSETVMTDADPQRYVLDKALNYGNSGGPIVSVDTGQVHAFCSRFQPVFIPQAHLKDQSGKPVQVVVPSLYGIAISLSQNPILRQLTNRGVPISDA